MKAMIASGNLTTIASYHGAPRNGVCSMFCAPHSDSSFLPWHRLFTVQMEAALGEALPYWDWTQDGEVPRLWEDLNPPLHPEVTPEGASMANREDCPNRYGVSRKREIDIDSKARRNEMKNALAQKDIKSFADAISNPHGSVHVHLGCEMRSIDASAYDPLFYLHHTYVDYMFAYWQEVQKLKGDVITTPAEFNQDFEPFNKQNLNDNSITLENSNGRNTLDFKENLCYSYDELLFNGMTPKQFIDLESKKIRASLTARSSRSARCGEVCQGRGGSALVYVGVVLPRRSPSALHRFSLCHGGRCVPAGEVATFGMGMDEMPSKGAVTTATHIIMEEEVTEVMKKQGWYMDKDLEAKMTTKLGDSMPTPIIIKKYIGKEGKGEVSLGHNQNIRDYGDLLASYNAVKKQSGMK